MRKFRILWFAFVLSACGVGDVDPSLPSSSEFSLFEVGERLSLPDPGKTGAYEVRTYTPKASSNGYKSAIIYYPSENAGNLLPAITLSGGFTNVKEQMSWLGKHLASHGLVTIVFTPSSNMVGDAQIWANGHKASLETLVKEQSLSSSPLYGRINVKRMGVSGYSYGGAGAILAANQEPDLVSAAIPLCAYQPALPTSRVPYLFVTGTADSVASPAAILRVYSKTSTGQPKAFARFNGVSHFDIINGGRYHESIARYVTAWSLRFLADNVDYSLYLNGDIAKKNAADKSVFASASDYLYEE